MPYTSAGLPYPTTQDAVTDTDRFIRELAQAAGQRIKGSGLAYWSGGIGTNANGDATTVIPGLAVVAGAVAFALQTTSGQPVQLVCSAVNPAGNAVNTAWRYYAGYYNVGPFKNGFFAAAIVAWGTPS